MVDPVEMVEHRIQVAVVIGQGEALAGRMMVLAEINLLIILILQGAAVRMEAANR